MHQTERKVTFQEEEFGNHAPNTTTNKDRKRGFKTSNLSENTFQATQRDFCPDSASRDYPHRASDYDQNVQMSTTDRKKRNRKNPNQM